MNRNECTHIHYSDGYIFAKWTKTVSNTEAAGVTENNTNKKLILKNCAP